MPVHEEEGCTLSAISIAVQRIMQHGSPNADIHEKFDQTPDDSRLDDSLDLIVRAVREVGDGPARVDEDLVVEREDELGEDAERGCDL